jgi:hypothetical protein
MVDISDSVGSFSACPFGAWWEIQPGSFWILLAESMPERTRLKRGAVEKETNERKTNFIL